MTTITAAEPMPAWLARHIETATGAEVGARYARPSRCGKCSAWTLVGLDGEVMACTARVDFTPLSATGEVAARLLGRRTLTLSRTGGRLVLDDRDPWRIAGRPAGRPGATYDVVATHECHRDLSGALRAASAFFRTTVPSSTGHCDLDTDLIPF